MGARRTVGASVPQPPGFAEAPVCLHLVYHAEGRVARHGAVAFWFGDDAGINGFASPGLMVPVAAPLSKVRSWVSGPGRRW